MQEASKFFVFLFLWGGEMGAVDNMFSFVRILVNMLIPYGNIHFRELLIDLLLLAI